MDGADRRDSGADRDGGLLPRDAGGRDRDGPRDDRERDAYRDDRDRDAYRDRDRDAYRDDRYRDDHRGRSPPPYRGRSPPPYRGRSPPPPYYDDRRDYGPRRSPPPYRRSPPPYGRPPPPYRRSPPPAYRRSPPRHYDDRSRYDDRDRGRAPIDDRDRGRPPPYDDRRFDDRRGGYDDRGPPRRSPPPVRRRSPSVSPSPVRKKKPVAAPVADDGKPKRFWDGFQWVDADTKAGASTAQATRKDRRLYVGNLPLNVGLTEKQLGEFVGSSLKQRGWVPAEETDPVLSVWLSPENTYGFVELRTVEYANVALVSPSSSPCLSRRRGRRGTSCLRKPRRSRHAPRASATCLRTSRRLQCALVTFARSPLGRSHHPAALTSVAGPQWGPAAQQHASHLAPQQLPALAKLSRIRWHGGSARFDRSARCKCQHRGCPGHVVQVAGRAAAGAADPCAGARYIDGACCPPLACNLRAFWGSWTDASWRDLHGCFVPPGIPRGRHPASPWRPSNVRRCCAALTC